MTEGNYSNVGHRGPVYKGLGAMNPCDNLTKLPSSNNLLLTATKPEAKEKLWMDNFLVISLSMTVLS
jgi:hypothetical protein